MDQRTVQVQSLKVRMGIMIFLVCKCFSFSRQQGRGKSCRDRYPTELGANGGGGLNRENLDPGPLFVKALPPWQPVAGRGRTGAAGVCLVNICLYSSKRLLRWCSPTLSTRCKAALSAGVLWAESSQGDTKAGCCSVRRSVLPISRLRRLPGEPFVNRELTSQRQLVPNQ